MPTIERARHIKKMMGGNIYYDIVYHCFRVMDAWSLSLVRWPSNYVQVKDDEYGYY